VEGDIPGQRDREEPVADDCAPEKHEGVDGEQLAPREARPPQGRECHESGEEQEDDDRRRGGDARDDIGQAVPKDLNIEGDWRKH
jgi:hypothetical protein